MIECAALQIELQGPATLGYPWSKADVLKVGVYPSHQKMQPLYAMKVSYI